MENLFVVHEKQSAVDIVINSIKQLLLTRKLIPGDKLPSEIEISEGLGVSRGSVREAMKILSAFGVVEIKVGNGTYIATSSKSSIIDPLLFSFLLFNPDISQLSEFRRHIEIDIVELIITHKDENKNERQLLYKNMEEMSELRKNFASAEMFAKNDMAFHRILANASCNKLAKKVYDFVLDFLEHTIVTTHSNQYNGDIAFKTHTQIIAAIKANDSTIAKNAIENSVDAWTDLQKLNS